MNCNKVYKLFFYLQNLKNSLYFIYSRGVIMNKKGFAVSGMIYAILVLFLILVFSILSILGSRKLTFDKLKKDVLTSLNNDYISYNPNAPELYDNMIPIYYDEESSVWRKADSSNINKQWYDYNNKKWANAVILRNSINNSNLYDLSGNGNNGVLENGATITDEGVYFNGEKQGVGIKSTTSVDLGTNFTFAARVKVENNNNAYNDIIANFEGAGYGLTSTKDGNFAFSVYDSKTSKYITLQTKTIYPVGSWHIVVGTYDGTTLKIYVDGVLSNSLSTTLTPKVSSTMFALGANPSGTTCTSGEDFNGTISDALVIKTTLSADTIIKYYGTKFNYQ